MTKMAKTFIYLTCSVLKIENHLRFIGGTDYPNWCYKISFIQKSAFSNSNTFY